MYLYRQAICTSVCLRFHTSCCVKSLYTCAWLLVRVLIFGPVRALIVNLPLCGYACIYVGRVHDCSYFSLQERSKIADKLETLHDLQPHGWRDPVGVGSGIRFEVGKDNLRFDCDTWALFPACKVAGPLGLGFHRAAVAANTRMR